MFYIESFESFSGTQSLIKGESEKNKLVSNFTISDQMNVIGNYLASNLPIFKSFKRSIHKSGNEILVDNDKYFRLFNNKSTFVYQKTPDLFTNDQFKELTKIVRTHIPYFIQSWNEWIKDYWNNRLYSDTPKSEQTVFLKYNAIIYGVLETDEDELLPFAYVCQMREFTESEAEKALSNWIDFFIDLTCTSGAENWTVLSIVKFNPNSSLLLK